MATNIGRLYAVLGADTSEFTRKMGAAGKKINTIGTKLTKGLTIPLLAVAAASVKTAADFEQAIANAASVTGGSAEVYKSNLQEMEKIARDMGATTVFSAKEAADGLYFMASAGWDVNKMGKAIKPTLDLAAATQNDLAFTTETVVASLSAFGLESSEAGRVTDTFSGIISSSQATLDKLGNSMTYIGPLAANLGWSIEETSAALGLLYDKGIPASTAGTSLRMAMQKLLDPTSKVHKGLKTLGLEIEDVDPRFHSLDEIVDTFSKTSMDAQAVTQTFGARGMAAILGLTTAGGPALVEMTDKISKSGTTSEMAGRQLDTFKGQWKLTTSALSEAGIQIGQVLMPILRGLLDDYVIPAIQWFSGLTAQKKKLILIIAGVAAAIGPLSKALLFLASNPLVAVATAAAAVVIVFNKVRKAQDAATAAQERAAMATAKMDDKMRMIADRAGISRVELAELTKKYDGNTLALGHAILRGKEGAALQEAMASIGKERVAVMDKEKEAQDSVAAAMKAAAQETKDIMEATRKAAAEEDKAEKVAAKWQERLASLNVQTLPEKRKRMGELKGELEKLNKMYENGEIALSDFERGTKIVNDELISLSNDTIELTAIPKMRDVTNIINNLPPGLIELAKGAKTFGGKLKEAFAAVDMKQVSNDMLNVWGETFSAMINGTKTFGDFLSGTFDTLASGVSSGLGKMVGNLAETAGGIFKALAPGIGSAVTGIVTAGLGLFKKLFKIKTKAEKEREKQEQAERQFTAQIEEAKKVMGKYGEVSDSTAEKIAELRKKHEGYTAVSLAFNDVISDVGVNQENINELWARAGSIIDQVAANEIKATDATAVLDDAFSQLKDGAVKLGEEGSAAMVSFILKTREAGVEVASVTEYVIGQLDRIPAALSTLIESQEKTGQSVVSLGKLAVTSFQAMLASGVTWTEAVESMKEPLAALKEKYKEQGIEATGALAKMFKVVEVTEANKELFDSIEANKEILEALGNTGFLTQETFKTFTDQAQVDFKKLKKEFENDELALRSMQPTLQRLADDAATYGYALDDNTQAIIDQAKELGLVTEAQETEQAQQERLFGDLGDRMGKIMQDLGDRIQGIFAKVWPSAFAGAKTEAKAARKYIDDRFENMNYGVGLDVDADEGGTRTGDQGGRTDKGGLRTGGIAFTPTVRRIAEVEPEIITPFSKVKELISGIAAGVGAGEQRVFQFSPVIKAMDSKDVYKFMVGPGREAFLKMVRANVRGVTREIKKETEKYSG